MGASFHLYYIDWEEFHQRFSVDLVEASEEGEVFGNSFWGEDAYEGEEFNLQNDLMFFNRIYENLKNATVIEPSNTKETGAVGKMLQRIAPSAKPDTTASSAKILQLGTSEYEFYSRWMNDFEFVFSRLIPYPFSELGHYRDSSIEFSPLEDIGTLSPETVRAVYARFPSSAIIKYPTCKAIINTPEYPSEARCADHYYFSHFLERVERIVLKAVDGNKGICSFIV